MTPKPPIFTLDRATELAHDLYGLQVTARALPAYYDQNFELRLADGGRRVLKISHSTEDRQVLELQNRALEHLAMKALAFDSPRVIPTRTGEKIATVVGCRGASHFVRLLTFIEGRLWADVATPTADQLQRLGQVAAEMVRGFEDFSHPAMDRRLDWDPVQFLNLRNHLHYLEEGWRRSTVEDLVARFENFVQPRLAHLPTGVIHSDVNQHNVIVNAAGQPSGVIDFGDVLRSVTVGEVAIAMAYSLLGRADPMAAGRHLLHGFGAVIPLLEAELDVVYDLVLDRLAMSVTSAARIHQVDPHNVYALVNEAPAWRLIERLVNLGSEQVRREWGRPPGASGID